jgi:hypothetical protein
VPCRPKAIEKIKLRGPSKTRRRKVRGGKRCASVGRGAQIPTFSHIVDWDGGYNYAIEKRQKIRKIDVDVLIYWFEVGEFFRAPRNYELLKAHTIHRTAGNIRASS